jgi:hypothetical protein
MFIAAQTLACKTARILFTQLRVINGDETSIVTAQPVAWQHHKFKIDATRTRGIVQVNARRNSGCSRLARMCLQQE